MNGPRPRKTAEDYESFIAGLCAMPPGPDRDECVHELTCRLLTMYREYGSTPPPALAEFAQRLGVPLA